MAREVARAASLRDCPCKSLAQALRSAEKAKCPAAMVALLRIQASEELDISRTSGPFSTPHAPR